MSNDLEDNLTPPDILQIARKVPIAFYQTNLERDMTNVMKTSCLGKQVRSGAETYINSIIIGSMCLLPYLVTGLIVNKVGKKPLIILSSLIFVGASLGLRWANSKTMMVALFAVDVCFGQTIISLNQAILVEHFPTTTRSLAISLTMMSGRIGVLLGNVAFSILLAVRCEIPFYALSGAMFCVLLTAFLLPMKKT